MIPAPRSAFFAVLLGVWLLAAWPGSVRANDLDQFQAARSAYESLNYPRAAQLFRALLAEALPFDRRPLVLESRKYLGATYLFLNRPADAEAQFELLVQADKDYVIDPLAFPDEVVARFSAVKSRLEAERAQSEAQRKEKEQEERARSESANAEEKRALRRLVTLASTETIEQRNSRWVGMVPFGAGQFQNGDQGLGIALATGQAVMLVTSAVTYLLHENLRSEPTPADLAAARIAEHALRYTNQISFTLFVAAALGGIIDAQVRFKPSTAYERPRPLPAELQRFNLAVGPGGVAISGRF